MALSHGRSNNLSEQGCQLKIPSRTRGETEVYRGQRCPNDHAGIRYKSTGQCVSCKRESGRKGSKPRGSLSDAVRRQARWIAAFEKNFRAVSRLGISTVLSRENHNTPLQKWLYRMRTRWDCHPTARRSRLISLGEEKWWRRTALPRHQTRIGPPVGSPGHKEHRRAVNKTWRVKNGDKLRKGSRYYYATNPKHRQRVAAARRKRYKENPGEGAYRQSLRRQREKAQRCDCCSNQEIRAVYLRNGSRGLDTDHRTSLGVAIARGWNGMHCVFNLQGLPREVHRKKTNAEIGEIAAIRRDKGLSFHTNAHQAARKTRLHRP